MPVEEGLTGIGGPFYFRDPVSVPLTVKRADNDLLVLLNGDLLLTASEHRGTDRTGELPRVELPLRAGDNELLLMVANGGGFQGNQTWRVTRGWQYDVEIAWPPGSHVSCGDTTDGASCFRGAEDGPYKDGPHHGRVFPVATASIEVDRADASLRVTAQNDIWERNAPVWARAQGLLWDRPLSGLPLEQSPQIRNYLNILSGIQELLTIFGLIDDVSLPNPDQIFAVVRGNKAFERWVQISMEDQMADRIADLEVSLAATLEGHIKPFESFDRSLTESVRAIAEREDDTQFAPDDIRVWTALEQRDS